MEKYLVIAQKWDDTLEQIISYIAGEFEQYRMARLFADIYNERYHTTVRIIKCEEPA